MSSPAAPSFLSALSSPFSKLPVELVQNVIELTVPYTYRSATYSNRQATLRSLCLVSKLFRQIAQPLLISIVLLSQVDVDLQALATRGGPNGAIKIAVFSLSIRKTLKRTFKSPLPFLRHLTISYRLYNLGTEEVGGELGIYWLRTVSDHLVTLQLSYVNINVEASPVFRSLERLAIFSCGGEWRNFLDRSIVPALAAFAHYSASEEFEDYTNMDVFSVSNPVFDQLEILSLDNYLVKRLDVDFVEKHGSSLLIDLAHPPYSNPSSGSNISSARAYSVGTTDHSKVVKEIESLNNSLKDGMTFRTIYVPARWKSLQEEYDRIGVARSILEERASELGIELISEVQPGDPAEWAEDPVFSEEFIRRRRVAMQKAEGGGNRRGVGRTQGTQEQ